MIHNSANQRLRKSYTACCTHLPNSEIKLFIQTVEGSQHIDRFETHKQLENTNPCQTSSMTTLGNKLSIKHLVPVTEVYK